jgi:hypothetical protein
VSLLKFKETVVVAKTAIIAAAVVNAANVMKIPADMLVTSGNDGEHMKGSKHYTNEALDFRTHHLCDADKQGLLMRVIERLGKDYDAFIEDLNGSNEHLHIEFDPKTKVPAV